MYSVCEPHCGRNVPSHARVVSRLLVLCLISVLDAPQVYAATASPFTASTPAQTASNANVAALRVCADPNNLPFSNERGEGFENALAQLLAVELGTRVEYTYFPQRRGFVRHTLNAGRCDLIIGVPAGYELTATTRPYYRSSYAFVSRRGSRLDITSFDDPRLKKLTIGLHVIGDDYSNVPPAQALATRGLAANVRGYSIYGDYSKPDPPRALLDAVARGKVDVAVVWGPLAGYFATRTDPPLDLYPIDAGDAVAVLPTEFSIAMGLRRDDGVLRARVQDVLDRRRDAIEAILDRFGVPRMPPSSAVAPGKSAARE
jgi:mxaJ protein